MSRRKKKRMRCPKCSGKKITLLNKGKNIWECLNTNCKHKFLFIPQTSTYLALTKDDVVIQEAAQPEIPVELTEKPVKEVTIEDDPPSLLDDMADKLGFK